MYDRSNPVTPDDAQVDMIRFCPRRDQGLSCWVVRPEVQAPGAAQRQGGLALRFVGSLGAIRGWVSKGLTRLILAPIVLICTLAALSVMDPRLGVVAALPVVVGLAAMFAGLVRTAPLYAALRSRRPRLSTDMAERVAMAPELRLLGRMHREQDLLADKPRHLTQAAVRKAAAAGAIRAIPDLLLGLCAALVLLMASLGDLAAATAAWALAAVGLMIGPMRNFAGVADRYRDWAVARQKCERLLAAAQRFELDAVLDRLDRLDGRVSEGARNLSVGKLWRILMARLHLGAFDLILVDVPETALDSGGIALLAAELHRRPATVLVATGNHDLPRTLGLDTRLLDMGRSPQPARKGRA